MLMNFHFLVRTSLHSKLAENDPVVTEKSRFKFHMQMTLGQCQEGQEMTLTYNTHISSLTQLEMTLTDNTHISSLTQLVSGRRLQ